MTAWQISIGLIDGEVWTRARLGFYNEIAVSAYSARMSRVGCPIVCT